MVSDFGIQTNWSPSQRHTNAASSIHDADIIDYHPLPVADGGFIGRLAALHELLHDIDRNYVQWFRFLSHARHPTQ